MTFYIDCPSDVIQKRGDFGLERYEKAEFQKKVGEAYDKLKDLHSGNKNWINIDASIRGEEEIYHEILENVMNYREKSLVDFSELEKQLFVDQPKAQTNPTTQ